MFHVSRQLIIANWKMQLTTKQAVKLAKQISAIKTTVDLVLCPSFTALAPIASLGKKNYKLGAQDVFWEPVGAYTGEVAALDLKELGCQFVLIGHSERRQFFSESDEMVGKKVAMAFRTGLVPVICVGETKAERDANQAEKVVERQLTTALEPLAEFSKSKFVIAYEPVWAIGTGRTPRAEEIQKMHRFILQIAARLAGASGRQSRVIYGGSVDANNIMDFLRFPEVAGSLIGGASSDLSKFKDLIEKLNSYFVIHTS